MTNPNIPTCERCPKPGCGNQMVWQQVPVMGYHCPRNADAHELCAKLAESEARVLDVMDLFGDLTPFMDPPDGGSPTEVELVSRWRDTHLARLGALRSEVEALRKRNEELEGELEQSDQALVQALPWDEGARAHPYTCAWVASRMPGSNSGPQPCNCWLSVADKASARISKRLFKLFEPGATDAK